jgi:hypothetical protein
MEQWLQGEIAELKQKIQQDERDYRHADSAEAERLKEIIAGDSSFKIFCSTNDSNCYFPTSSK